MSHPVKRRVRDVVVPALGRSQAIQRRATRRMSQVYVTYPPGALARRDRFRTAPGVGRRVPDLQVSEGPQATATNLHGVLRAGRHVLVVPAAHRDTVRSDPALRPYLGYLDIVTGDASTARGARTTGLVVLVRPDGHVAARGKPGRMAAVAGYLRDLFGEPAGQLRSTGSSRKYTSVRRLAGSSSQSP